MGLENKSEKKCRLEDGQIICDDDSQEQTNDKVKKEPKEKCEFLVDNTNKQRIQVCSKGGKTTSARLIAGEFSKQEE